MTKDVGLENTSRIVWVCPRVPWPPQDGASVASASLIQRIAEFGHAIDLVCFANDDSCSDSETVRSNLGVATCTIIRRGIGNRIFSILKHLLTHPWTPITFRDFCSTKVRHEFLEAFKRRQQGCVVLDGLHVAALFKNLPKRSVYRAHNVEAAIWKGAAAQEQNLIKAALLRFQHRLVSHFEGGVSRRTAAVAAVSKSDALLFSELYSVEHVSTVPIGMEFGDQAPAIELPSDKDALRLLFVGRLDWRPNREGLVWFLKEVWPRARANRRKISLEIVGSGSADGITIPDGATLRGRVPDLDEVYARADAVIIPIFYGSGTRVKAIEAARYGRAIISTAMGVEGLELVPQKTFIEGETADEWVKILSTVGVDQCRMIGSACFEALKLDFDDRACAARFNSLIVGGCT